MLNLSKRICLKYNIEPILLAYPEFSDKKITFYIDKDNSKVLNEVIEANKKKIRRIIYTILSEQYNDDLYGYEARDSKTKNIKAMKIKSSLNPRIYCQENYFADGKRIVMVITIKKKSQKLDKKIISILEKISKYDYEYKKEYYTE